jgi:outer membrane protein OmpA-like peptidoglycan-associated protein
MDRVIITAALLVFWSASSPRTTQGGRAAPATPRVPLVVGLMTVGAVHEPDKGDYESILRVGEISADGFTYVVSGNVQDRRYSVRRKISTQDFAHAHGWRAYYGESDPEFFPGTTGGTLSVDILTELKTKGKAALKGAIERDPLDGLLNGILGGAGRGLAGILGDANQDAQLAGTLSRVESQPVAVSMLVNDARVDLSAVHARGTLGDDPFEIFILDDPALPLLLRWQVGDTSKRMVRISFPVDNASSTIETKLSTVGRAEIYGIYFDFAKATIRPESEPVLKEIAALMTKNPRWTLSVEGHTDNIGRPASNLDLSTRRAVAVRQALADRYQVAPDRLLPAGFGSSRPKETNDTLEGRARNRRVELVRQGAGQ